MQKDFKIGIIAGLFVVILLFLWLAALPSSSIFARLGNIQKAQADAAAANKSAAKSSTPANVVIAEQTPAGQNYPGQRFHIVMKSQTLSEIAKIYYGSGASWTKIRDANPTVNPDKIAPGTRLYIPP